MSLLEERIRSKYYKANKDNIEEPKAPALSSRKPSAEEAIDYLEELDTYTKKNAEYSEYIFDYNKKQSELIGEFFRELFNQYFTRDQLNQFDPIIYKAYEVSRIYDINNELDFAKTHDNFKMIIPVINTAMQFFTKR
jgi:hypothetical protein